MVGFPAGSSRWWSWTLLPALLIGSLALCQPADAAPSVQVLGASQVTEAAPLGSTATAPADGRLRGPDFTASVTRVVWPQSVSAPSGTYVAGSGRRLVAFSLSVTQASANAGIGNAPSGVTAKLEVGTTSLPVPMSTIDQQIAGGTSGSAQTTGTDSFVASMPARSHAVSLTLSEDGFSQSLDLWTLERVPPSPVVLYRDQNSSTVSGTAAGPFHVSFTNPADGFSSSDDAQIQSATLGYFAPGSSGTTPGNPAQAFLVLEVQSSYPSVPYGQPDWGHFFSGFTPLSGSQLTFTPSGGSAVPATADTADFSSTNAASDDDGLFDALYSFTVPATTTGGTLSVLSGTASGTEYTGFTGTGTTVPITITSPATVGLNFPAVPAAPPAQKTPPWVGAPLPATGLAAAPASVSGSHTTSGSSGGGLPIWVVVLILVLVAGGVVAWQRLRRRPTPAMAAATASETFAPHDRDTVEQHPADVGMPSQKGDFAEPIPVAVPAPDPDPTAPATPRSLVLGPLGAEGLRPSDRRVTEELFHYLALHDSHRRSAEQILVRLRPDLGPDDDLSRKTIHTYLSELRSCVGAEHLPSATSAGGYLLLDVTSDWADFEHLDRLADATSGPEAWALRKDALTLVRGVPFADLPAGAYPWVGAEHLVSTMTTAIARCAQRLAQELLEAGAPGGAEEASRAGLRGAPEDFDLWRLGALAINARGDRSALRLWMTDAAEHLERDEIETIQRELGPHDDAPGDET